MRLAQPRGSPASPAVLLIRHESHGAQLSRTPDFFTRDVAVLGRKWRATVTASCGRRAYRRWRFGLVEHTERCRAARALEAGAGERTVALSSALRLARELPWSAPHVARALAHAVFGRPWSGSARRRLDR